MKKLIACAIIFVGFIVVGYSFGINNASFTGFAPVQPINFSHKIHAGDNGVPCKYCHAFTERSRHAGVPSVERCMGCHKFIKTDSPEIQKLKKFYDDKEPIPWVKVYNLPDFVYFPHKRHVRANVDCKTCHGDVASMSVVERPPYFSITSWFKPTPLTMGWCLRCHHTVMDKGATVKKVDNGWDCWTCHQ